MVSLANIRTRAQRGFTLVELLIVVIILAILAAIVVPQFGSSTDDAKLTALDSNLSALRSAVAVYKQQHDGHFPGGVTAVPDTSCTGAGVTKGTGDGTAGAGAAQAFADQLTMYTSAAGGACGIMTDVYKYGPYIKAVPADPIKNIATVTTQATGALTLTTTSTAGGWLVDTKSGRLINNNVSNLPNSTSAKYSER